MIPHLRALFQSSGLFQPTAYTFIRVCHVQRPGNQDGAPNGLENSRFHPLFKAHNSNPPTTSPCNPGLYILYIIYILDNIPYSIYILYIPLSHLLVHKVNRPSTGRKAP